MDIISTIAVVASVLFFAMQARSLAGQQRIANEVAGTQAHRELLAHYTSVTDVFIQFPNLYDLYFDGTDSNPGGSDIPPPRAEDIVRLKVTADLHGDFLSMGVQTGQRLAAYATWAGEWSYYIRYYLASSSYLRSQIRDNVGLYPDLGSFIADYDASADGGAAA